MYSSNVSTDRAVTLARELGSTDMVQHVALYLRNLPWLPTDDFIRQSYVLPIELKRFLKYPLFVTAEDHTAKVQRTVSSPGQDICRAATKGQQRRFILFAFSSASSPPEIVI